MSKIAVSQAKWNLEIRTSLASLQKLISAFQRTAPHPIILQEQNTTQACRTNNIADPYFLYHLSRRSSFQSLFTSVAREAQSRSLLPLTLTQSFIVRFKRVLALSFLIRRVWETTQHSQGINTHEAKEASRNRSLFLALAPAGAVVSTAEGYRVA